MDLLVEDATFVTMAEPAGPAEAMLVRDGRIAAIGPAGQVRAAAGRPQVVRLDGATVIPGLIDAHCHVTDVGYLAGAADCSQPSAPGIEAIQARLREAAGRTRTAPGSPGAGTRSTSSARTGTRRGRTWTKPCPAVPRSCTTRPCTPAC